MTVEIHGTCDDRFTALRDILADSIEAGTDVGASVALTIDGEMVVDIWGGWADEARTEPWESDTITNVWSTTKTMTALCALIVADRGELDFDAPVSRYWPEFAAAGKGDTVLVRHLLGHTSGLAGWTEPITVADYYDWDKATSLLAAQEPWWEPGTASGYHAVSQGYLVGEVIRRITGESLGTFFRKEVAEPLGADFHIGLEPADFSRVSNVIPPPPMEIPEGVEVPPLAARCLFNPPLDVTAVWTDEWRKAEIPAAGGHGNARSVALAQAVLANGGEIGGKRLLSAAGCEKVLQEQSNGTDLVLGIPVRFGLGYGLQSDIVPINPSGRGCFWGGYGGSVIIVDMERRATFAYMMNKMASGIIGDDRSFKLLGALAGAFTE